MLMRPLLLDAAARANRYLEGLESRSVVPSAEAISRLPDLGRSLPQHPDDPEAVLAALDAIGSPATMASAGGRYFGFVVGGSLPAALAANWLAGAWDQNAGLAVMSPTAVTVEEIALQWLIDVLHLPHRSGRSALRRTTRPHGCTSTGHSACGRRPRPPSPISPGGRKTRIRGRWMRTNGSTRPTTAGWPSSGTRSTCPPR